MRARIADPDEVSDLGFAACCLIALLICMGCCVNYLTV